MDLAVSYLWLHSQGPRTHICNHAGCLFHWFICGRTNRKTSLLRTLSVVVSWRGRRGLPVVANQSRWRWDSHGSGSCRERFADGVLSLLPGSVHLPLSFSIPDTGEVGSSNLCGS